MLPEMERALLSSLMEMYINGVSTRKVKHIMEPLRGENVSESMVGRLRKEPDYDPAVWNGRELSDISCSFLMADASYVRVRSGREVIKRALLAAVGVDGKRVPAYSRSCRGGEGKRAHPGKVFPDL